MRLVQRFAVIYCDQPGQFVEVCLEQIAQPEQVVNPLDGGHQPPLLLSAGGSLRVGFHLGPGRERNLCQHFAGRRVDHVLPRIRLWRVPLSVDLVRESPGCGCHFSHEFILA